MGADEKDAPAPLRPAATVLLLRDRAPDASGSTPGLEAAMIERCDQIAFAGGATVFPGGRVDAADHAPAWRAHADGLSADPVRAAAEIAAVREAFEETGVLLAHRAGDSASLTDDEVEKLDPWRAHIEADATLFLEMIAGQGLRLSCSALVLFAHWTAPPDLKKRYDALFFAARAPQGQRLREDGVEATKAIWVTPDEALAQAASNQRRLIFPTARTLELLGVTRTVDEALDWARRRVIRSITPYAVEREGALYYAIPEGLGYPVTEVLMGKVQHG